MERLTAAVADLRAVDSQINFNHLLPNTIGAQDSLATNRATL